MATFISQDPTTGIITYRDDSGQIRTTTGAYVSPTGTFTPIESVMSSPPVQPTTTATTFPTRTSMPSPMPVRTPVRTTVPAIPAVPAPAPTPAVPTQAEGVLQQLRSMFGVSNPALLLGGGETSLLNLLPSLVASRLGRSLPAFGFMPGAAFGSNQPAIPEVGIGKFPWPWQAASNFWGYGPQERNQMLDLWQAVGISPEQSMFQMQSATPGYRFNSFRGFGFA